MFRNAFSPNKLPHRSLSPRGARYIEMVENLMFTFNKKKILLRGVMTRKRIFNYPKFITAFNGWKQSKPFTLGQLAGLVRVADN
jgi:hypothetical protein